MTEVHTSASARAHAGDVQAAREQPAAVPPVERYELDALRRRLLAVSDILAVLLTAGVLSLTGGSSTATLLLACSAPLWVVLAKLTGLYDRDHRVMRHLTVDELPWIAVWALVGVLLLTVPLTPGWSGIITKGDSWIACLSLIAIAFVLRAATRRLWRLLTQPEQVVVVGDGPSTEALMRKIELFPDMHVQVCDRVPSLAALNGWLEEPTNVSRLIVASGELGEGLPPGLLADCRRAGVKLTVVPAAREMLGTGTHLGHIAELPMLDYNTWDISRSTLLLKRLFDVVVSVVALLLLLPVFAGIALAIYLYDRGPVLFSQRRAGLEGAPFTMWKFRTMVVGAEDQLPELVRLDELEEPVFKLRCDPRVTPVGRVLRRFSLDELPQLVNVVRSEMSFVGPRPEQLDLVERYLPEHLFRLRVKPGLTGPMQVYGRGELTFQERLSVEQDYIDNLTLGRDIRVLLMTLPAVLGRRGAF